MEIHMIFTVDNVSRPADVCSCLSAFLMERNAGFPINGPRNKSALLPLVSTEPLELRVSGLS